MPNAKSNVDIIAIVPSCLRYSEQISVQKRHIETIGYRYWNWGKGITFISFLMPNLFFDWSNLIMLLIFILFLFKSTMHATLKTKTFRERIQISKFNAI